MFVTWMAISFTLSAEKKELAPQVGKLSEARFEAVGLLEFTDPLCEFAKTRIQAGNPTELIDLTPQTIDLKQQLALQNLGPKLDLMS